MGHFGGICFEMNDCDIESFVYLYSSIEESNKEYIITDEMKIDYKNKYNISNLYLCKVSSDIRNSNSNLFLETYYVEDISNLRRPRRICGNKVA